MKGIAVQREIRELILKRAKEGESITQLASEFNINPNTIRKWLSLEGGVEVGTGTEGRNQRSLALLLAKSEREKQDLMSIIGELTVQLKELSKKKSGKR